MQSDKKLLDFFSTERVSETISRFTDIASLLQGVIVLLAQTKCVESAFSYLHLLSCNKLSRITSIEDFDNYYLHWNRHYVKPETKLL